MKLRIMLATRIIVLAAMILNLTVQLEGFQEVAFDPECEHNWECPDVPPMYCDTEQGRCVEECPMSSCLPLACC